MNKPETTFISHVFQAFNNIVICCFLCFRILHTLFYFCCFPLFLGSIYVLLFPSGPPFFNQAMRIFTEHCILL